MKEELKKIEKNGLLRCLKNSVKATQFKAKVN
jgi:hypothetical protein